MRERLQKKMSQGHTEPKKQERKEYTVFACKKCSSAPKIVYDQLVPSEMLCVVCRGIVVPKVISQ